jgi:hypothetical protein
MFTDYSVFEDKELARIAVILRGAFDIRTADGEDDELLGDFIQALDDRVPIIPKELDDDALLLTDRV